MAMSAVGSETETMAGMGSSYPNDSTVSGSPSEPATQCAAVTMVDLESHTPEQYVFSFPSPSGLTNATVRSISALASLDHGGVQDAGTLEHAVVTISDRNSATDSSFIR